VITVKCCSSDPNPTNSDLFKNRNTNIDCKCYRNKLNLFMETGGTVLINAGVVSGQGTSTLTLTNSVVADAGSYDVVSGTCLRQ
jgi:hypothetical protein